MHHEERTEAVTDRFVIRKEGRGKCWIGLSRGKRLGNGTRMPLGKYPKKKKQKEEEEKGNRRNGCPSVGQAKEGKGSSGLAQRVDPGGDPR